MIAQSRDNAPDFSDCLELQRQLQLAVTALVKMTSVVAAARHVREYDTDRRKRILAIAAMPFLKAGLSSAAADTEARASQQYADAMKVLGNELVVAEKALAEWDATKIKIEVARSLLSLSKATISNL